MLNVGIMSNTPPSDPASLRVQTNLGKKKSDGKSTDEKDKNSKVNGNAGEVPGPSMSFAGEMERRGEEKVSLPNNCTTLREYQLSLSILDICSSSMSVFANDTREVRLQRGCEWRLHRY